MIPIQIHAKINIFLNTFVKVDIRIETYLINTHKAKDTGTHIIVMISVGEYGRNVEYIVKLIQFKILFSK